MRVQSTLILALILGLPTSGARAQSAAEAVPQAVASPGAEPALLTLPRGVRVRLRTAAAPGTSIKGVLASADAASLALVPEGAPPLGGNTLQFPIESVARLELQTGEKRHPLAGLVAGVALGVLAGFAAKVDPVACESESDATCSRGQAVTFGVLGYGAIGALVGGFIKTDEWTPVALDTLAPPAPRSSGVSPQLRVLPRGGVTLGMTVGF